MSRTKSHTAEDAAKNAQTESLSIWVDRVDREQSDSEENVANSIKPFAAAEVNGIGEVDRGKATMDCCVKLNLASDSRWVE